MREISVYIKNYQSQPPTWCADIPDPRDHGKMKRRCLRTLFEGLPPSKQNKKTARQVARKILARWTLEAKEIEPPKGYEMSIDHLLRLANRDPGMPQITERLAQSTIRRRARSLSKFQEWFLTTHGNIPASQVRAHHTSRWSGDRRSQQAIRRVFNFAAEQGYLPDGFRNPIRLSRTRQKQLDQYERTVCKAYSEEEIEKILHACRCGYGRLRPSQYLWDIVELLNETGLRSGELMADHRYETAGLTWKNVDLAHLEIRVTGKTGSRRVPLTRRGYEILTMMATSRRGPLVIREKFITCAQTFGRLLKALKLCSRGFRGFRHRFALRLGDAGVPPNRIMALMGHRNLKTTSVYLRSPDDDYGPELRKLLNR